MRTLIHSISYYSDPWLHTYRLTILSTPLLGFLDKECHLGHNVRQFGALHSQDW